MMTPDPFELLLGNWRLTRDISGQAIAHGVATVQPLSLHEARYDEQVTLELLAGPRLRGSASYLFRRLPDCSLDVLFPHTGKLFHQLHFAPSSGDGLIAEAIHPCVADLYYSTYRLHTLGHIAIQHRVLGPHKDYTIQTTLTRLG